MGQFFNPTVANSSYASKSVAMAFPYRYKGDSFAGLSKPQYSYLIFNSSACLGASLGARASRYNVSNGIRHNFIPPSIYM